jgi:hypothetical protein
MMGSGSYGNRDIGIATAAAILPRFMLQRNK